MKTMKIRLLVLCIGLGVMTLGAKESSISMLEETILVKQATPFCKAVMKGDVELVKKMIALGENVNKKSLGKTPLMFAARYNKSEIAKILIASGAKLKLLCNRGMTAQRYAELSNAKEALAVINVALQST